MTKIQPRPTIYKGIKMRSRLEARFAAGLDLIGADWEYEPHCFASEHGQYLPDFKVAGPWADWYIEVKPNVPDLEPICVTP